MLTRGLGRSYGDASLPPPGRGPVACSRLADRVLEFDEEGAGIRVEAGMRLGHLVNLLLPRGWFVPVVPGTRDVTVGGMLAADVHGKNHHRAGTIGRHVAATTVRLASGMVVEASRRDSAELLRATLGGMGLTGHILDATLRLERVPSDCIVETTTALPDLESLVDGLERAAGSWPFTVAWCDLLARGPARGRGVLSCGRWASGEEAARASRRGLPRLSVPGQPPRSLLSDAAIRALSLAKYELARRSGPGRSRVRPASSFFWPLDAVGRWNLVYGPRGLLQYQCVLPRDATLRSYRRLVEVARSHGPGPFLVVLKDFGDEGDGMLSFPMPGLSFAMDFPVHDGSADLVARLNEVVLETGGRIYLAKDALTTAMHFAAMEKRLPDFVRFLRSTDPERRIDSALARRLFPD